MIVKNVICIKTKDWQLLLFVLNISLMVSCNFDQPKKAGNLKVDQRTISQAKSNSAVKLSSGPAFSLTKQAACCKGVPSRAKALAAKAK